jgi:NADH dehydrogenase
MTADLLLCGGTGNLGSRIAARLVERGVRLRALVRPESSAAALRSLGAEISLGDLRDDESLAAAVDGVRTVVTTANAITRLLSGVKGLSIASVDREGNAALIRAAEAAGVERFVFVSMAGISEFMVARAPFAAAKEHTERLLAASPLRSVIIRPAPAQGLWLGRNVGVRPDRRRAVVFGRGRSGVSYLAEDDAAEACARLATMDDPPAMVEFGGPEVMTRHEVVDALERAFGARFRRLSVPRAVLAAGSRVLRRPKPEVASVMGMSLAMDVEGCAPSAEPLRELGIEPRPMSDAIRTLASSARMA